MEPYNSPQAKWERVAISDISRQQKLMDKIYQEFKTNKFLYGKGQVSNKDCRREVWE